MTDKEFADMVRTFDLKTGKTLEPEDIGKRIGEATALMFQAGTDPTEIRRFFEYYQEEFVRAMGDRLEKEGRILNVVPKEGEE